MSKKKYEILSTAYDKNGNIICRGKNDYNKSNTWQKELSIACGLDEKRIYLHSELHTLIQAKNLRKLVHTLKIERFDAYNKPRIAFPCISCQMGIKLSGVKRVIFTTDEGYNEWIV